MATRLKNLRLSELSLVDRPANKGAKVTIFKRDFSEDDRKQMADKGQAMPDGSYPIANVDDLKNAVRSFGRATNKDAVERHIIARARALDAVDQLPEDWGVKKMDDALDTVTKRWIDPADGAKPFSDFLQASMESQRYCEVMEAAGPVINALDSSLRSIAGDGAMDATAKQTAMREAVEAFMTAIRAKSPDLEAAIAKVFTDPQGSNAGPSGDHVSKKERSMPDENKKVADLEKAVADLTKRAETAEAIAKMTDVEKAHYDKLSDADKAAFIAKSADTRKADIAKAGEADPVVYKAADGTEFRKSADPQLVAMAKRMDEAEKIATAERDARETAEFTKRAETEMPHLPGTPAEKAALLKALSSADEAVKKTAEAILKAGEGAIKGAFDKVGVSKGRVEGSPEAKLDSLAKAHAEKNNVSFAKAYDEVLKTEEGKRLYAESRQAAA